MTRYATYSFLNDTVPTIHIRVCITLVPHGGVSYDGITVLVDSGKTVRTYSAPSWDSVLNMSSLASKFADYKVKVSVVYF